MICRVDSWPGRGSAPSNRPMVRKPSLVSGFVGTSIAVLLHPRGILPDGRGSGASGRRLCALVPTVRLPRISPVVQGFYSQGMGATIRQRELRNDSGAIMRRVEQGESFVVTRNGAVSYTHLRAHETDSYL